MVTPHTQAPLSFSSNLYSGNVRDLLQRYIYLLNYHPHQVNSDLLITINGLPCMRGFACRHDFTTACSFTTYRLFVNSDVLVNKYCMWAFASTYAEFTPLNAECLTHYFIVVTGVALEWQNSICNHSTD